MVENKRSDGRVCRNEKIFVVTKVRRYFTDDYVDRTELFVHVVKLLVGQYKYDKSKHKPCTVRDVW